MARMTRRKISSWAASDPDGAINLGEVVSRSSFRPGSRHGNRWTIEGTLKLGFERVGGMQSHLQRQTHNEMAAISMCALAYRRFVDGHLQSLPAIFRASRPDTRPQWL